MSNFEDLEEEVAKLPHTVLINHEEQYSIWLADLEIPDGWQQVWGPASRDECIQWVDEVWTDLRPLSLRKSMEEEERKRKAEQGAAED